MNYQNHYNTLMQRPIILGRKKYKKSDERYVYYEKHHIIPKCLGGTDDESNLVLLTPEEHYVAHQLLVKIYPAHYGILYSAIRMTQSPIKQRMNNKLYSWLKIRFSEKLSILNEEGKIGIKGRHLSDEHKLKISKALSGRSGLKGENNPNFGIKRSEDTRQKMRENNYFNNGGKQPKGRDSPSFGLKRSEETCNKISKARTGVSNGTRTEETKSKMREKRKLQTKTSQKEIMVFGVKYNSLKDACENLGRNHKYIIHRLKSDKFPDCYYL